MLKYLFPVNQKTILLIYNNKLTNEIYDSAKKFEIKYF